MHFEVFYHKSFHTGQKVFNKKHFFQKTSKSCFSQKTFFRKNIKIMFFPKKHFFPKTQNTYKSYFAPKTFLQKNTKNDLHIKTFFAKNIKTVFYLKTQNIPKNTKNLHIWHTYMIYKNIRRPVRLAGRRPDQPERALEHDAQKGQNRPGTCGQLSLYIYNMKNIIFSWTQICIYMRIMLYTNPQLFRRKSVQTRCSSLPFSRDVQKSSQAARR